MPSPEDLVQIELATLYSILNYRRANVWNLQRLLSLGRLQCQLEDLVDSSRHDVDKAEMPVVKLI